MSSSEIIAGLARMLRSDGLEEVAGILLKESKNVRMIELALEELYKEADEQLLLDAQCRHPTQAPVGSSGWASRNDVQRTKLSVVGVG